MDEKLEAFLAGKSGQGIEAAPSTAPEPVVVEATVVETPALETEPASSAPEPVASATAPAHDDDDDDDAAPVPSGGTIPVHVLQAERNKRRDYKAQVIRQDEQIKAAEERFKALQAQLDELKKAPPPAPAAPPQPVAQAAPAPAVPAPAPEPMPNPAEDPEGYARWYGNQQARQSEQLAQIAFSNRLDQSEDLLREKEGDEVVDKAIASFKAMVAAEEQTFGARQSPLAKALTVQRNPYKWMHQQVKKAEADKEINGDLAGFRAKTEAEVRGRIEAEIRAQIEAEMAAKAAAAAASPPIQIAAVPVRSPPNVVLPRSLANAPSAAPRSAPAWTGPTALADIVARR